MRYTYIIAEIGPNHNGNIDRALSMIKDLAKIGVNAVKFQINKPENSYSKDSFKPSYQKENVKSGTAIEMSKSLQLPFEDHLRLNKECNDNGVDYLCTAFEMESLRFIHDNTDMAMFKIPSGELLTLDILEYVSSKNKPILLSTGMATYDEIEASLKILNKNEKKKITVFHCVSNYPAPAEDINLNVMLEIKSRFNVSVGFSDHTVGNDAAIAAVALGAEVIEKHVTFDKCAAGPDHKASSTIDEFSNLVMSIRNVEKMMGTDKKIFSEKELEIKKAARKSIVTKRSLLPGHIIGREDVCFKRPGFGYYPTQLDQVIGKEVKKEIESDRVILKEHLS